MHLRKVTKTFLSFQGYAAIPCCNNNFPIPTGISHPSAANTPSIGVINYDQFIHRRKAATADFLSACCFFVIFISISQCSDPDLHHLAGFGSGIRIVVHKNLKSTIFIFWNIDHNDSSIK